MLLSRQTSYSKIWLISGLSALLIATLLAVILVAAKTPFLAQWLNNEHMFQKALVLHVNFNMLFWIGSLACYVWIRELPPGISACGLILSVAGAIMWLAAFILDSQPMLNNYIPVYDHPLYLTGLILVVTGHLIVAVSWLWFNFANHSTPNTPTGWSKAMLAMLYLVAVLAPIAAWIKLDASEVDASYYEKLFWAGGHILQAFSLQLMITLWLTMQSGFNAYFKAYRLIWSLPLASAMAAAYGALFLAPDSMIYREFFTNHMRFFGFWILPVILLAIDWRAKLISDRIMQLAAVLFLAGAFIGLMIRADNLMVPAHYHALTGAINLTAMGFVLHQIITNQGTALRLLLAGYAASVAMLATGLAWSGALGGIRKVTLSAQTIQDWQHTAILSLMGIGGIMAALLIFLLLGMFFLELGKNTQSSANEAQGEIAQ